MATGGTGTGGTGAGTGAGDIAPPACGDGMVSASELCDTAIAAGQPGACPTDCGNATCPAMLLMGSECTAECVTVPATCGDDDACCPTGCTLSEDADCTGTCGDGIVNMAAGELCEPGTAQDCPTNCDDSDPCTSDTLSGSSQTCDAVCDHQPVAAGTAGDGCCPSGATFADDADCSSTPQEQCLALVATDACSQCACMACTTESLACLAGSNATANAQCEAVVTCSRDHMCRGDLCFWTATGMMTMTPDGPCLNEITAAAGGNPQNAGTYACMSGNPLYDAVTLGECTDANCATECPTRTGTTSCP